MTKTQYNKLASDLLRSSMKAYTLLDAQRNAIDELANIHEADPVPQEYEDNDVDMLCTLIDDIIACHCDLEEAIKRLT